MNPVMLTIIIAGLPTNVIIAIVLFGIGYATFTLKLQRFLTNPKKMREAQAEIQKLTKEMNEMVKRGENIAEKQAQLMPLIRQSMQGQLKTMFIILPVFFGVYYGLIPAIFGGFSGEAVTFMSFALPYNSLFIVTAIICGLVLSMTMMMYDKSKAKAAKPAQVQQLGNNTK